MTYVAYGQAAEWNIPAYVWPAVLGISVAAHLGVLIFGASELSNSAKSNPPLSETEIVIENRGLQFETVKTIDGFKTDIAIPTGPEALPTVQTWQPLEAVSADVVVQKATEPTTHPPAIAYGRPEAVQSVPTAQVASSAVKPVDPQAIAVKIAPSTGYEGVEVARTREVARAQEINPAVSPKVGQAVTVGTGPPLAVGKSSSGSRSSAPVETIKPVKGAPGQSRDNSVISSMQPLEAYGSEIRVRQVTPVTKQGQTAVLPVSPTFHAVPHQGAAGLAASGPATVGGAGIRQLAPVSAKPLTGIHTNNAVTFSVSGSVAAALVPEPVAAQAVKPLEQKLAAVQHTAQELPTISPAVPVSSNFPARFPAGEPTQNVAPVEVAGIDPLAKATDYVAAYETGDCAHLTVMSAGRNSAAVTAYGAELSRFSKFEQAFAQSQGYAPKIELRRVTGRQCALLNALSSSAGIEAAGLVVLDRTVVRSGTSVSGIIRRDLPLERIAAAEQAGLQLNGRGAPELYVIDASGRIHDGRRRILPASNARSAGGWRFSVPVRRNTSQEQETALVLTVWNRPQENQPPRFGSLPASRIKDILQKPGVFSLAAFNVSR